MTASRYAIEQQVFEPERHRLLKLISVHRPEKRRRLALHLCLTVDRSSCCHVSIVKCSDRGQYKRKHSWPLSELRKVDGKSESRECTTIDLMFDKTYSWSASSPLERNMFITNLWMMCNSHRAKTSLTAPVQFVNVPGNLLESFGPSPVVTEPVCRDKSPGDDAEDGDSFKALTVEEESDLMQMMTDFDSVIEDTDSFAQLLTRDLCVLDGDNVQSIMASEQQMDALISVVQSAIDEMDAVEGRLDAYDQTLATVRRRLREMDGEKSKLHLTQQNQKRLLQTMEELLPELTNTQRSVLSDPELTSSEGISEACQVAGVLRHFSQASLSASSQLQLMTAAAEQKQLLHRLRTRFSRAIGRHMTNLLAHLGNEVSDVSTGVKLPDHSPVYEQLRPYTELIHWAKDFEAKTYTVLLDRYEEAMSKRYKSEMAALFATVFHHTTGSVRHDSLVDTPTGTGRVPSQLRQRALRQPSVSANQTQAVVLLASDSEAWTNMNSTKRLMFADALKQIVSDLENFYLLEQQFCQQFFLLDINDSPASDDTAADTGASTAADTVGDDAALTSTVDASASRTRALLTTLFASVATELTAFIAQHEREDLFCAMHVPVCLSNHVKTGTGAGTGAGDGLAGGAVSARSTVASALLQRLLVTTLLTGKRSFDRLMNAQMESLDGYELNRRPRCGILPFVANFQNLVQVAESVFGNTSRHSDWQRWCVRLLRAIVVQVTHVGKLHQKTPLQVVQLENYHHLHAILMKVKIAGMDEEKRMVKQHYNDALKAYVARYLDRPLIKLNQFFDGVQQCVSQGVRESEVGYQLAFNKQELKKIIKEYSGKEVKKALETLYRKMSKHLYEEQSLLQVAWYAMQEEFINQYKSLEEMIQRCYPGALLSLEFSIDDLLRFFSDIARQH